MNEHCPGCPFPEGVFCYALQGICDRIHEPEIRRKFLENLASPDDSPVIEDERPSMAETIRLLSLMHACPERTPETDCGCGGMATCRLGKGRDGLVNHHDCIACLSGRAGPEDTPGPDRPG